MCDGGELESGEKYRAEQGGFIRFGRERSGPDSIEFSPHARENLLQFRKRDQQIILDVIEVQLSHQPVTPTKHRKRLEENPLAP